MPEAVRARWMRARLRPRRLRSLRMRATAAVALVLALPLIFVYGSAWLENGIGERMLDDTTRAAAEALSRWSDADPSTRDAAVDAIARRLQVRVRLLDPDGRVALDVDHERPAGFTRRLGELFLGHDGAPSLGFDAELAPLARRPEILAARRGGLASGCGTSDQRRLLVCHAAATRAPDGIVAYAQEGSRRTIRALYDSSYQLKKLLVVVTPIAAALAWWLSRGMVRPIERLREQALAQAERADPGAVLEWGRADEVGDLAQAFNTLLASLQRRSEATQEFMSDVVHELKSPVATVRACAEALADGPPDAERIARLARALTVSSQRLDAVVTELLELARAEGGLTGEERAIVDLGALARGVVEGIGLAPEAAPALRVDAADGVLVEAVLGRLESAIRNLVENAASFAGAGDDITVAVRAEDGEAVLEVTDSGPGIRSEHLPHVFDRFFTGRGERRGTGLGLALVRAVAEAHGGRVDAANRPEGGARFRILLPLA